MRCTLTLQGGFTSVEYLYHFFVEASADRVAFVGAGDVSDMDFYAGTGRATLMAGSAVKDFTR